MIVKITGMVVWTGMLNTLTGDLYAISFVQQNLVSLMQYYPYKHWLKIIVSISVTSLFHLYNSILSLIRVVCLTLIDRNFIILSSVNSIPKMPP